MIRRYRDGDHLFIGRIYHEAVRRIACADYSPAEIEAWAPGKVDFAKWRERCARMQPFVDERAGRVVGFLEFETNGHIDCAYVDPDYVRQGVMSGLMRAAKGEAVRLNLKRIYAEVSITARPFFERHEFVWVRDNYVNVRGVTLKNFLMECCAVSV